MTFISIMYTLTEECNRVSTVSESQWIALVGQWKVSEKDFWHNWFLLLLLLDISSDPSFCGFPALELKIFLNLGDNLSWKSMEILHSWAFQSSRIQKIFNHGKSILSEKNAWNSFILEHFRAAEFKISFNQGENILCDINENPSFWSISEQQNSKFPSTMVKISSVIFIKILHSGAFQSSRIQKFPSVILMKILLSGAFQSSRIQNFLQPWWKYSLWYLRKALILEQFTLLSHWIWVGNGISRHLEKKNHITFWRASRYISGNSQWNQYLFRCWVSENDMFYLINSQWKSVNTKI